MSEDANPRKRPVIITILCIIYFIVGACLIPSIVARAAEYPGSWFVPLNALLISINMIGILGLWFMQKWGAYLYTACWIINVAYNLGAGTLVIYSLIFPAIVIFFALYYLPQMS